MLQRATQWARATFHRLVENPLVRRMLKNSGYLLSATGLTYAMSMFQSIFSARLLGVAGLGLLGAIIQFTTVINKLVSFRMSELVVTYVGQFTEQGDLRRAGALIKAAFLLEALASLLAFSLIFLLAPLGARFFAKDAGLVPWFLFYSVVTLVNLIYQSTSGMLQIFDRFRQVAMLNVYQSAATLSLVALAYFRHGALGDVLLAYIVGKTVGAVGVAYWALRSAGERLGADWWRAPLSVLQGRWREITGFLVSTNLSATFSLINKGSEILWISFFRGPVEAGYYKQALALANLVLLPVSPLPQATFPEIAREIGRKQWGNVREVLRKGSFLAAGYTAGAALGLAIFGRWLISWLYGEAFLPAYPALLILLVGLLAANTFYWNRTALLALGRPDIPTKINFGIVIGKVIGMILLLPVFGYLGSAALLSTSHITGTTLAVRQVYREIGKQEAA